MPSEVSYLTTSEVAAQLRVDPSTVRRWAETGAIAAVKLPGGHYRFHPEAVNALVSAPSRVAS